MKRIVDGFVGAVLGAIVTIAAVAGVPSLSARLRPAPAAPVTIPAELDALYRSAVSIRAATNVGISYAAFGEKVRAFATDIDLARPVSSGSNDARAMLTAGDAAMAAYADSLSAWRLEVDRGPVVGPLEIQELATKYGVEAYPDTGNYRVDDVIRGAWSKAGESLNELTLRYTALKRGR